MQTTNRQLSGLWVIEVSFWKEGGLGELVHHHTLQAPEPSRQELYAFMEAIARNNGVGNNAVGHGLYWPTDGRRGGFEYILWCGYGPLAAAYAVEEDAEDAEDTE